MSVIDCIMDDFKNDLRAAMGMRLPWWGVLSWMAACAIMAFLLVRMQRFDLFMPTFVSIGMLGVTIAVKWRLRRYAWFWFTMTLLAALHVPLILLVPWTTKWVPAPAVAAVGSADIIVMLAVVDIVRHFMTHGATNAERP